MKSLAQCVADDIDAIVFREMLGELDAALDALGSFDARDLARWEGEGGR